MNPVDQYIYNQVEPYQSIMLYVRSVQLKALPNVVEKYRYRVLYYVYNNKPICYLIILNPHYALKNLLQPESTSKYNVSLHF